MMATAAAQGGSHFLCVKITECIFYVSIPGGNIDGGAAVMAVGEKSNRKAISTFIIFFSSVFLALSRFFP